MDALDLWKKKDKTFFRLLEDRQISRFDSDSPVRDSRTGRSYLIVCKLSFVAHGSRRRVSLMQFHNGVTKFREDQRDRAPNLFTIYQLGCWSTNVRVFESCSFPKSLGPVADQIPLNSYIIRIEWTAGNRKNEPSTFRLCALDDG